jgi:hypothetical protein
MSRKPTESKFIAVLVPVMSLIAGRMMNFRNGKTGLIASAETVAQELTACWCC